MPCTCTHSEGHLGQQVFGGDEGFTWELVDKQLTGGKGTAAGEGVFITAR